MATPSTLVLAHVSDKRWDIARRERSVAAPHKCFDMNTSGFSFAWGIAAISKWRISILTRLALRICVWFASIALGIETIRWSALPREAERSTKMNSFSGKACAVAYESIPRPAPSSTKTWLAEIEILDSRFPSMEPCCWIWRMLFLWAPCWTFCCNNLEQWNCSKRWTGILLTFTRKTVSIRFKRDWWSINSYQMEHISNTNPSQWFKKSIPVVRGVVV